MREFLQHNRFAVPPLERAGLGHGERSRESTQRQHNLDYHLGLNNFLQTDNDRRDQWRDEYYTYLQQSLHSIPKRINTPELELHLPQLTFIQLKQKYSQFWGVENSYFVGGETQAKATLNLFLTKRFHGYHWKVSRPWLTQQGATSHLSPHLTFGTILVRQVYQLTKERAAELANNPKAQFSLKAFRDSEALPARRDRLRWHDSFTQRLHNHLELAHTNRYKEFDEVYSPDDLDAEKQELFEAWQEG